VNWLRDKNLHGSRDFYFLIKFIVYSLKPSMLDDYDFPRLSQILSDIAIKGIGRNFEGSKDSFKTFIEIHKKLTEECWERIGKKNKINITFE
jgi:hypothetical protein